jgi:RHS repeat-associated protein
MNVPLTRSEVSVLGAGSKVTIWDYDDDDDTTPNENPGRLLSRLVEQGFTRDSSGATVPYEYVTTFTYNAKGQVESIDGPLTGSVDTTTFTYEAAAGNLLSIVPSLIGATGFSGYDAAGQPATVTDVNGQSDSFTYDARGRITEILHAADSSTRTVTYNTAGLPDMIIDEDGVFYAFEYDGTYGRLVRKNDMDGNYIRYAYDSQCNLIERSRYSAAGDIYSHRRWNYRHPVIPGRLFKEIKYDNSTSEYDYDADGNVSAVTDFNLNTTTYEYDPLKRLITVTEPESATTSYAYDRHGNLFSVMDAENRETTYTYDDMGRAVAANSPDSGQTTYAYDAAGNLLQKTDANGITVQYAYDALNRLIDVQFPDAAQDIGYSYDAGPNGKGRRTGMTDPWGNTGFAYDSRGRLVGKTTTVNAVQYEILRAYTPAGRQTSFVYPTGRTVDFARYENGKIRTVSTTANGASVNLFANMTYDPFGRASGMDTATGSTINNQSGACNCLEKINPGRLMEQVFTQDGNGNIIDIAATNISSLSQSFVYDGLNRLVSATGVYGTIDFSYDKVGNRLTRTVGGQSDIYSYVSGTSRLGQITGPNAATFSYDAGGNITGIDSRVFVYNQNDRLVRVEEGGEVLGEYTYNGLGQRVLKDANSETTVFLYDFDGNIVVDSRIDGEISFEYLYMGSNRIAMADAASGNLYYYNNNYLGTPLLITDSDGDVVWDADYLPFGKAEVSDHASVVNNFRFSGQYYDEETGLHYNYRRYYDPKTGRYLTPDPIGLAGGINPYLYASANPTNYVDPYGLFDLGSVARKIIGDSPGDIFTIGLTYYHPVFGILGLGGGFSFDRVIMPSGEADWFLTVGVGGGIAGGALSIDRGWIRKWGSHFADPLDFCKDDITGFNVSADVASILLGPIGVGAEGVYAPFNFAESRHGNDEILPMVTGKGGLRIGTPGAGVLGNYTFDLPF